MNGAYLQPGLSAPVPATNDLDKPFWDGLHEERLPLRRCQSCHPFQWGPE